MGRPAPAAARAGAQYSFFFSSGRRHTSWPRDWSSDVCSSDLGLVAVRADADRDAAGEVDALDVLEEAVDEVLPALLAVGDDVDARGLLLAERDQHGVALALREGRARQAPRRPEPPRLREPGGLGQTAGDRRQEHGAVLAEGLAAVHRDSRTSIARARTAVYPTRSLGEEGGRRLPEHDGAPHLLVEERDDGAHAPVELLPDGLEVVVLHTHPDHQ